jgi:ATP-dependent DNA helicase RecQ
VQPAARAIAHAAREEASRRLGFALTDIQRDAVTSVLRGRDTLLVSPTGSGKSAVYQLAGAMTAGVSVVVTPLLALQEDQLAAFEALDVGDAVAISSLHGARARADALARLEAGQLEFVLLSPEQLGRSDVRAALRTRGLDRLVVDEAHCIDLWGADLRPDYAVLGAIRTDLGNPAVLATTATAPPHVREEIASVLHMEDAAAIVAPTERRNIDLAVVRHPHRQDLEPPGTGTRLRRTPTRRRGDRRPPRRTASRPRLSRLAPRRSPAGGPPDVR